MKKKPLTHLRLERLLKRLGFLNVRRPQNNAGYMAFCEYDGDKPCTVLHNHADADYLTRIQDALRVEGIESHFKTETGVMFAGGSLTGLIVPLESTVGF